MAIATLVFFVSIYVECWRILHKMFNFGLYFLDHTQKLTFETKIFWRLKGGKILVWHMPHQRLKGLSQSMQHI